MNQSVTHLIVREGDIETTVTREFYEEHRDEHDWEIIEELVDEFDPNDPQGTPIKARSAKRKESNT